MRLEDLLCKPIQWSPQDTKVNAVATATWPGVAGKQHFICGISISASAQPTAAVTVTIKDGSNVLDQWEIPAAQFAPIVHNYTRPFVCSNGGDAIVTVGAMGSGVRGTAVLKGFSGMAG